MFVFRGFLGVYLVVTNIVWEKEMDSDVMNAAKIYAQSVSALFTMESMKAENRDRESKGLSQAYGEKHFDTVNKGLVAKINSIPGA